MHKKAAFWENFQNLSKQVVPELDHGEHDGEKSGGDLLAFQDIIEDFIQGRCIWVLSKSGIIDFN